MRKFLFVGEAPSNRAKEIGATWRNGRLSGKVLHDALRHAGIDPLQQRYTNLFRCSDGRVSSWGVWRIRKLQEEGWIVVALGKKVQRVLWKKNGIWFLPMIHPAARGEIRLRDNYRAHVKEALGAEPETPW